MKTTIKINEEKLGNLVKKIVEEVLFNTLPKHDASGNMYTTMLEGKPYLLKEGLITTYPIKNVIFALKSLFNLYDGNDETEKNKILFFLNRGQKYKNYNGLIFLNKYSQNNTERIEIKVNENDFNQNDFDKYLLKYGWFCGIYEELNGYNNLIRLIYEKKFDIDVTEEVLKNKYIYHICPNIYLNRINKSGLKPKYSSWNQYSNPERIYFFMKELTHDKFVLWVNNFNAEKKFNYQKNDGWSLLKIDTSVLTNNPNFYFDPRMKDGVYTMDAISPESIEIIDYISKENMFDIFK